jgi:hypothetical protein
MYVCMYMACMYMACMHVCMYIGPAPSEEMDCLYPNNKLPTKMFKSIFANTSVYNDNFFVIYICTNPEKIQPNRYKNSLHNFHKFSAKNGVLLKTYIMIKIFVIQ